MRDGCAFCDYSGPSSVLSEWHGVVFSIRPLQPVTPGHVLVIPRMHLRDASEDLAMTGLVFSRAAELARDFESYNLITSTGRQATQSVRHLHVHMIPRRENDGLLLPWDGSAT